MTRKRTASKSAKAEQNKNLGSSKEFHLEFLNASQENAWREYQNNDILFMLGSAGTGKTFLASSFAVYDLLQSAKQKIVITRPVVEAGESLGFLPGDLHEKVMPYMMPIYDSLDRITGNKANFETKIKSALEIVPLAFMRGRTFDNAVFILDEAQNCSYDQIKLAITRLGFSSKMIITGDPSQSDLPGKVALTDIVEKVQDIPGIGVVKFKDADIVRHSLIGKILKRL